MIFRNIPVFISSALHSPPTSVSALTQAPTTPSRTHGISPEPTRFCPGRGAPFTPSPTPSPAPGETKATSARRLPQRGAGGGDVWWRAASCPQLPLPATLPGYWGGRGWRPDASLPSASARLERHSQSSPLLISDIQCHSFPLLATESIWFFFLRYIHRCYTPPLIYANLCMQVIVGKFIKEGITRCAFRRI